MYDQLKRNKEKDATRKTWFLDFVKPVSNLVQFPESSSLETKNRTSFNENLALDRLSGRPV